MAAVKPAPIPLTRELEAAFLWCLLRDPDAMARFGDWLDPRAFPHAGPAVEAIAAYAEAHGGRAPSPVVLVQLVANRVEAGSITAATLDAAEELVSLGEGLRADGAFDPAGVLEQVAERMRTWHSNALAVEAVPRLVHATPEALAQVHDRLGEIRALGSQAGAESVALDDPEAVVALFEAHGVVGRRSPTGNSELDAVLGGGLGVGELGIIQGGTGAGKSFMLSHAAVASLEKDRALVYVTLELSVGQVYLRMYADLFAEDLSGLQDKLEAESSQVRQAARESMRANLTSFLAEHKGHLYVKWLDPGAPVSAVRQVLEQVERRHGVRPAILCVDYADRLGAKGRHDTSYAAMGEVYCDLRQVAVDYKIPVWTGSQTTRAAQSSKIVDEADGADSMHKVRHADVVVSICRTQEEKLAGILRFYLAKNRSREAYKVLGPYKVGFPRGRPVDEDAGF